jgi:4-amino-4-deoxy-L-arabinose transferase-like glycosyltransferase
MVTIDLKWPATLKDFFNTSRSPLNPHNKNYSFFVYGTFPVFITKAVAGLIGWDDYGRIILVGRFLSVLLEIGICFLVYLIVKKITGNRWIALFSLFLYSCLITPIQLAHFYATDTWLTFFIVLSFYLTLLLTSALKSKSSSHGYLLATALGVSVGLIGASKINGFLFLPIIGLLYLSSFITSKHRLLAIGYTLVAIIACLLTFRLAQPYLFAGPGFFNVSLNPKAIANWQELAIQSKPENSPPFGYQWIPTKPLIYPAVNLFFWGLGIPFSVLILISFGYLIYRFVAFLLSRYFSPSRPNAPERTRTPDYLSHPAFWLCLLWILCLFVYQGSQFAKALRYFYLLMPFLAIVVGIVIGQLMISLKKSSRHSASLLVIGYTLLALLIIWNALAFQNIYLRPHTRVQASAWIFQNVKPGSTMTTEIWDDGLPLTLSSTLNSSLYRNLALPLYDPDTPEKWLMLAEQLYQADYVVLSSNRLWRSISSLPGKYPVSSRFYSKLLSNQLGFQTAATFTSYPCLIPKSIIRSSDLSRAKSKDHLIIPTNPTPPPITLTSTPYCLLAMNDDGAEESFTVYDHPKVIILKNTAHLDPSTLLYRIAQL